MRHVYLPCLLVVCAGALGACGWDGVADEKPAPQKISGESDFTSAPLAGSGSYRSDTLAGEAMPTAAPGATTPGVTKRRCSRRT